MHSGARRNHCEHDRKETRVSPAGRGRRGHRFRRDIDHLVHCRPYRRATERKCSRARFASRNRTPRRDRVACDHELVFSQNLLGRMDPGAQSPPKELARGRERRRNLALAPVVGIDPAGIYVALSRGVRGRAFLQSYHLRLGGGVVLKGALLGLVLTGMVAVLTFVLQQRLPYRKMLITTGILLGVVLLVMVGEQAQEMQLAHWIPTTEISSLKNYVPPWMGLWFAVFPTVETLIAQFIAALLVVGSYYAARHFGGGAPPESAEPVQEARVEAKAAIVERLETVPAVSHR